MYDKTDLRSALASAAAAAAKPVGAKQYDAEYGLFYKDAPSDDDANGRTWYTRGQNFIVAYTAASPGAVFERTSQIDEYMLLLPYAKTPATLTANGQSEVTNGYALVILPPGDSRIELPEGGTLVRLFTTRSVDLVAKCANASAYAEQHHHIPPLADWPAPRGGFQIRIYSLDVPPVPGRFGRIWRSTNMMVNMPQVSNGPRDPSRVSPHHHDDFEQGSLALEGEWQHHMRWPWLVDMNRWREDLHAHVGSPSITVIPAQVIHTSTWTSAGRNQLVDIFSPPRADFSKQPGWVLNADDYPVPEEENAA